MATLSLSCSCRATPECAPENCSFIICRRAPPQALRAWHFLCWALATCFLISQLPGTRAPPLQWDPGARAARRAGRFPYHGSPKGGSRD